ncbi:MAG: TIM barrel protein [Bryobacterales bacterium]|nr:TIM barrel protein [Bryobacterales bacterium]
MKRRAFLCSAAASLLAAGWSDRRLGVACNVSTTEGKTRQLLAAAAAAGFRRIQLFPPWKLVDDSFVHALPGWVNDAGLQVAVLGAYVNCCQPANVIMNTREQDFVRAVDAAGSLGARYLTAWTGGWGANLMTPDPRNFTPQAGDRICRFVEQHARRLEDAHLRLALEQYNTLACPDAPSLRRVLDRLPPFAGAVLDPPNLTKPADFAARDQRLTEMFAVLKGRVAVVHLKDFTLAPGGRSFQLPGAMQGAMNYPLFVRLIGELPDEVPLIAEHIGPAEFASTRKNLLGLFHARG